MCVCDVQVLTKGLRVQKFFYPTQPMAKVGMIGMTGRLDQISTTGQQILKSCFNRQAGVIQLQMV